MLEKEPSGRADLNPPRFAARRRGARRAFSPQADPPRRATARSVPASRINAPSSSSLQSSRSSSSSTCPREKEPCCHGPPTKWECICGRSPALRCWTANDEMAIAEKVCRTRRAFLTGCWPTTTRSALVLAAARKAAEHKLRIDYVVDVQGIDAAARQEAFHRLHAGVKVLQRALRRNRRDLRIAGDRQQPAERRKAARQSLLRRRRAAAVESRGSSSRSPC